MKASEVISQRKSGIVSYTLVELLILMVFAAILFAIAVESEISEKASNLEIELRAVKIENEKLKDENKILKGEINKLKQEVRRLRARLEEYRMSNGEMVPPRKAKAYFENLAPPACKDPSGFLLKVSLQENGNYKVLETSASDIHLSKITGLSEIVNQEEVSKRSMELNGSKIRNYGEKMGPECIYTVDASERVQHSDLSLYLSQMSLLREYFYVKQPQDTQ